MSWVWSIFVAVVGGRNDGEERRVGRRRKGWSQEVLLGMVVGVCF